MSGTNSGDAGSASDHPIHAVLAGYATRLAADSVVADLGCGPGGTLAAMIARRQQLVLLGMDLSAQRLAAAQARTAGRDVLLVRADLSRPLPLRDGSIDLIVCHNVIELLTDPIMLLRQVHRTLRPAGLAVLSHADFSALVVHGPDPVLTHRILDAYAHVPQPWMRHIDPLAARRLPHLAAQAGLTVDRVDAHTIAETRYAGPAQTRLQEISQVVAGHIERRQVAISERELSQWQQQIQECAGHGSLLYAETAFITVARREPADQSIE